MRAFANKKMLALLALVAAAAGFAVVHSTASHAAAVPISLCAKVGSVTLPDSTVVPTWAFVSSCSDTPGVGGIPGVGGPVLDVNQGDVVTINLTTDVSLSLTGHTASFELAGLPVTKTGATTYQFTASRPGTFIYQSPGQAGRQIAMGLYGALIVRPTSAPDTPIAGQAYGDASTAYEGEQTLVLSAIDPTFNAAPDTFDLNNYLATYWLINGKAYPDTAPGIAAPTTGLRRLLLRYVNAGYDNTAMSLLGVHEHVIARDANPLNNPFDADAETIPAGGTEDAIVTVPTGGAPSASGFPLFNRNLHVTNGTACVTTNPCVPRTNHTPGGMLTFITP